MSINTRETLAVVDDELFYTCGHKFLHGQIASLADLADQAELAGLTHVWALPGTNVSRFARNDPFDGYERISPSGWNVTGIGKDAFSYLSVRRESKRHEDHIELGFPEWSRWPWKGDDDPRVLLATLVYLENAIGFPVAWSPAWTSLALFKRMNANRWDWLLPVTVDLESKGFSYKNEIAHELHWPPRGQAVVIPPGKYELRVDVNSAYNGAEAGLNVGSGEPVWAENALLVYDGKMPGIWRLSRCAKMDSIFDGNQLPDMTCSWATTDMIEQMRRVGYSVGVDAGWYWEPGHYHQVLRSTAELLWDLRVLWRKNENRSVAHKNVHETIRVALKALHGKLARKDNAPRFRRPDIWAMVVARSVAMSMYKIMKIYLQFGMLPVRIKADEFTYVVDDPHIFDAILDRDKLGGLKLVSCEIVSEH